MAHIMSSSFWGSGPCYKPREECLQALRSEEALECDTPKGSIPRYEVSTSKNHTLNGFWDRGHRYWVLEPSGSIPLLATSSYDLFPDQLAGLWRYESSNRRQLCSL